MRRAFSELGADVPPTGARRSRLAALAVAFGVFALVVVGPTAARAVPGRLPPGGPPAGPAGWVDPFVGTAPSDVPTPVPGGATGATWPGVSAPFGAVQWSPDTPNAENETGYAYGDSTIEGFSMTHFSGAGCENGELVRVMPVLDGGDVPAGFSHAHERAYPGYYGVGLDNGVVAELTSTTRVGFGRFTFPRSTAAGIVVDAAHRNGLFPILVLSSAEVLGDREIRGTAIGGGFCGTPTMYRVHFRTEFDRPFRVAAWNPFGNLRVEFDTRRDPVVRMKTALSFVDAAGAAANLQAELPGWSFGRTRAAAVKAWNALLGRVRVSGGSGRDRRIFTTALYHSFLHPNTASDVDGRYLGFDGAVHTTTGGSVHYANFSGWDVYRSQVQLLAMVVPERARDVLATLVDDAERCGGGFDKWTTQNVEASVMIGDPGAQMVANLDAFGVGGVGSERVLPVMERSAFDPATRCGFLALRPGLATYMRRGFTPTLPEFLSGSPLSYVLNWIIGFGDVSVTMEYAMADAAIASYAGRHGDTVTADLLRRRAANWENVFDPDTGYVRPRLAVGWFATPFDPTSPYGFTEGNAAQYTWMVPQAYGALVARLGGNARAVDRLDTFFEKVNAGLDEPHFYIGNEPLHTAPWAYLWAGAPWRTQDVVRRVVAEAFDDTPGGLPGNDDLGATSAWLVWAALGMFPVVPGEDFLALNTPLFPEAVVDVPGRSPIRIRAPGAPAARYVRSATRDAAPLERAWLAFSDLAGGAELDFVLDDTPSAWGSRPGDAPPSLP